MKLKTNILFYFITIFIFVACSKDSEVNVNESVLKQDSKIVNFVGKNFTFDEVLEALSSNYNGKNKIALLEFEYLNEYGDLKVSKHSELDGFSAAFVLAMYGTRNNGNLQDSFSRSSGGGGCTEKQKQKGKCYDITCHKQDGTSSTTRCGGMIGCSSTIKGCLDAGGCIEACRVPPSVMYISGDYDHDEKSDSIDKVLLFPGQD